MKTFLFHDIIFGPVQSRRLGQSLGINLMPTEKKICNFNCIYCECGWSFNTDETKADLSLPSAERVLQALKEKLITLREENKPVDVITFAGNGEPTLHPSFPAIINQTIQLRDKIAPGVQIAVLSNASKIDERAIFNALQQADQNILKLDAGSENMCQLINKPHTGFHFQKILRHLQEFQGNLIIQTLFLKGIVDGQAFDNTTDEEVNLWLQHIQAIAPQSVMIYSLDRNTPQDGLEKISPVRLREIADQVNALGIDTRIAT